MLKVESVDIWTVVRSKIVEHPIAPLDVKADRRIDSGLADAFPPGQRLRHSSRARDAADTPRTTETIDWGVVLLLAVELCTINCRTTDHSVKNFVSTALFGDGAAALLLCRPSDGNALPRLVASGEHMWRRSEYMMGWSIEDDGFGVVLSPDIPKCARDELRPAVDQFLDRHGLVLSDIDGIIMHPGGRKVLEAAQSALALSDDALCHAWDVLAEFGNMSSPTALFVLERTLSANASGLHLLAAFGPGFTVSFALLDL